MSLFFGLFLTFLLFVFEVVSNKHHRSVNVEGVHDKSLNPFVFILPIRECDFRLNLVEFLFIRFRFFVAIFRLIVHLVNIFCHSDFIFEIGKRSIINFAFFQVVSKNHAGIELLYHCQGESELVIEFDVVFQDKASIL